MRPAHRVVGLLVALVLLAGCGGTDEPEEDQSGAAEPEAEGDVISFDESEVGKDAEATARAWLEHVADKDFEAACEISAGELWYFPKGETTQSFKTARAVDEPKIMEQCLTGEDFISDTVNDLRTTELSGVEEIEPRDLPEEQKPAGKYLYWGELDGVGAAMPGYFLRVYDFDGTYFVEVDGLVID